MTKVLYYRYVKTCSLNKVLKQLRNQDVLSLEAWRSGEEDKTCAVAPIWIKTSESTRTSLEVNFNSVLHGPFRRKPIREVLTACDLKDAVIRSLDVYLHRHSPKAADELARVLEDDSYRNQKYVAHFDWHPCRRELEKNQYTEQVSGFMAHETREYGFEPASLDFTYVLPLPNWRELSKRKRKSKKYKETLENWETWFREVDSSAIRKIAIALFSKGMTSGRQYRLGKEDQWILHRVGDI